MQFEGPDPIRAGEWWIRIVANDTLASLSAIKRKAVLAIKAATTSAGKQAAIASINWAQTS